MAQSKTTEEITQTIEPADPAVLAQMQELMAKVAALEAEKAEHEAINAPDVFVAPEDQGKPDISGVCPDHGAKCVRSLVTREWREPDLIGPNGQVTKGTIHRYPNRIQHTIESDFPQVANM